MFEQILITEELSNKRLDQIITELEIVNSRNKAVSLIMSGKVFINEKKIDKPGKIIKVNSVLKYKKEEKDWVSRGGIKLHNALKVFNVDIKNKVCLFGSNWKSMCYYWSLIRNRPIFSNKDFIKRCYSCDGC